MRSLGPGRLAGFGRRLVGRCAETRTGLRISGGRRRADRPRRPRVGVLALRHWTSGLSPVRWSAIWKREERMDRLERLWVLVRMTSRAPRSVSRSGRRCPRPEPLHGLGARGHPVVDAHRQVGVSGREGLAMWPRWPRIESRVAVSAASSPSPKTTPPSFVRVKWCAVCSWEKPMPWSPRWRSSTPAAWLAAGASSGAARGGSPASGAAIRIETRSRGCMAEGRGTRAPIADGAGEHGAAWWFAAFGAPASRCRGMDLDGRRQASQPVLLGA